MCVRVLRARQRMTSLGWQSLQNAVMKQVCGQKLKAEVAVADDVHVKQKQLQQLFARSGLDKDMAAGLSE